MMEQEPSLFAVAKLLETGLVNMNRVEVLWRPVTNHLLEVCHHPVIRMREWGIEAITTLVRSAVQYQHSTPLRDNQVLKGAILYRCQVVNPIMDLKIIDNLILWYIQ